MHWKNSFNCGELLSILDKRPCKKWVPARSQLLTTSGDICGAKGNSGDAVIKAENTDNRRSEDSLFIHAYYIMIKKMKGGD